MTHHQFIRAVDATETIAITDELAAHNRAKPTCEQDLFLFVGTSSEASDIRPGNRYLCTNTYGESQRGRWSAYTDVPSETADPERHLAEA